MWRPAETDTLANEAWSQHIERQSRIRTILAALQRPEWLFLIISAIAGVYLIGIITPMVGGNEVANFQRAASIAQGRPLVAPVELPGGMVDLIDETNRNFPEGSSPPYSLTPQEYEQLNQIRLDSDRPRIVPPNPIAVLNPVSYLPQAFAIALGKSVGLPPLNIFYLGRLAGLIAALALMFAAIRLMPIRKYSLAAVALFPPILFSRSTLDADQVTNGLAFLFVALALRAIVGTGVLTRRNIVVLAVVAALLAQSKSAYLLMPLMTLAIPAERFGSRSAKWTACALFILPGLVTSVAWMLLLKHTYFADATYQTWSGLVDPARQLGFVLTHPFEYALVVLRTVFGTVFLPWTAVQFVGSFGPPVVLPLAIIGPLAILLTATILSERVSAATSLSRRVRVSALALSAATVFIILTLLYVQWTRFGGPVIDGFNGRYLYPLAPLLLIAIPLVRKQQITLPPAALVACVGLLSAGSTCWTSWHTYIG